MLREPTELGTATITQYGNVFLVCWLNHGSFLRPIQPWAFDTEQEAREWCEDRNLRVVQ